MMINLKISTKQKSKGAAMIEYVLGLSVLVFALLAPVVDKTGTFSNCKASSSNSNKISAIGLLECSLKIEYAGYSEAMANPR